MDTSVAMKWVVEEEGSDAAASLWEGGHDLHAPHLTAAELGNALWRKARQGEINPGNAGTSAAYLSRAPIQWADDPALTGEAVRLALALNHPDYDCFYLALAHRVGAVVVTADEHFLDALAGTEHEGAVVLLKELVEY